MNTKDKPMVELIGGPFCGAVVPWPEDEQRHTVVLARCSQTYVLERGGKSATAEGWLRDLRK